jgi:hypothetical protein
MLLVGCGVYYGGYYDYPYDYYGGFGYPYYYGFHGYYDYPYGHWGTGHRDWDDSHRGGFGGFPGNRDRVAMGAGEVQIGNLGSVYVIGSATS